MKALKIADLHQLIDNLSVAIEAEAAKTKGRRKREQLAICAARLDTAAAGLWTGERR